MNKKPGVSILSIAFLLTIPGGVLYIFRCPLHFPVWEPAVEAEPIPGVVSKEFVSIEDCEDDKDSVLVNYILTCDQNLRIHTVFDLEGKSFWWIDYNLDGGWYTVYRDPIPYIPEIDPLLAIQLPEGQYERQQRVPRKIIEWEGRYRIYFVDSGYLEFTID